MWVGLGVYARLWVGIMGWGQVKCNICVFFVCCEVECPCSMFWAAWGGVVLVCVCIYGSVVRGIGISSLCFDVVTYGSVCVRGAAHYGWYWGSRVGCG